MGEAALREAEAEPNERYQRFELALAHYARADRSAADESLAELIARDRDVMAYQIAEVYAWRGEKDKAFEWLQVSLDNHDTGLLAPVPSTQLFEKYRDYYASRGWCERDGTVRDLHLLNGKIFPFLQMNEGSVSDYVNLQRMMFMLNENYRGQSFNLFGDDAVSAAFRSIVATANTSDKGADEFGAFESYQHPKPSGSREGNEFDTAHTIP